MKKCKLMIWDSQLRENIFVDGFVINKVNGDVGENFDRIDVKTDNGIFYACHPDCVKII